MSPTGSPRQLYEPLSYLLINFMIECNNVILIVKFLIYNIIQGEEKVPGDFAVAEGPRRGREKDFPRTRVDKIACRKACGVCVLAQ